MHCSEYLELKSDDAPNVKMSMSATDKRRVLIVDDEQEISHVLKQGLEREGYSVDTYSDPTQALDGFKPDHYKRIILDIRMPTMSGFDLAHRIWQKDPDAGVCFLTIFEIYEDEADKVFQNFNNRCFIKKPAEPRVLSKHIETHISA